LTKRTLEWLQQNRIPGFMFGIAAVAVTHAPEAGTKLRGTNPSLTVKLSGAGSSLLVPTGGQPISEGQVVGAAPPPAAPQNAMPVKTVCTEIVPGILLDMKAARQRMRQESKARNLIVLVSDIKPLTHNRYFLFKGICLRCTRDSISNVHI
jgi:hypothetical protein